MKLLVILILVLLLILFQGVFWNKFWARELTVDLHFADHGVTEGEDSSLIETITNRKWLPVPVLHVKFQMGRELVFSNSKNFKITDQNYRSDIFSCMPWQKIRRSLTFRCTKRGYYPISRADLVSYDLMQTCHFVRSCPVETALYVYPTPVPLPVLELPLKQLCGQILASRSLIRDPFEMQSIRPYQTYDSFRDINWKATARTGQMKVNVYAPTASWQVCILLDVHSDRIWKDHSLYETVIRLGCSMALELLNRQIPVSIGSNVPDCLTGKPAFLSFGTGNIHPQRIQELCARIQTDEKAELPPMEQCLDSSFFKRNSDSVLYVLISPNVTASLAASYETLCRPTAGSQWICPHRPGEAPDSLGVTSFTLFPLEVPYEHS